MSHFIIAFKNNSWIDGLVVFDSPEMESFVRGELGVFGLREVEAFSSPEVESFVREELGIFGLRDLVVFGLREGEVFEVKSFVTGDLVLLG